MSRTFQIKKWMEVEATIEIEEDNKGDAQAMADEAAGNLEVLFNLDVEDDPDITILTLDYETNPHSVEVNDITDEKKEGEGA